MHRIISRKEYVKQQVRLFREFTKLRPPNDFELAMRRNQPARITKEEWAEAERELDTLQTEGVRR